MKISVQRGTDCSIRGLLKSLEAATSSLFTEVIFKTVIYKKCFEKLNELGFLKNQKITKWCKKKRTFEFEVVIKDCHPCSQLLQHPRQRWLYRRVLPDF